MNINLVKQQHGIRAVLKEGKLQKLGFTLQTLRRACQGDLSLYKAGVQVYLHHQDLAQPFVEGRAKSLRN